MSYTVKLDKPPAGYSLTSCKAGEAVNISFREFTSSEDGDLFISRLEGFPTDIIQLLPESAKIRCSTIDHLVAIIDKDGNCTVFANELRQVITTRARRDVAKGEVVLDSDIVDIYELKYEDLTIPDEAGILVVFSRGWRKGLFYDFGPIQHEPVKRGYNLWQQLGNLYNYLLFQDVFKITDDEWRQLMAQHWFPFLGLKPSTVVRMIAQIKNGWSVDDLLDAILADAKEMTNTVLTRWRKHAVLSEHEQFLATAMERFSANDFVSCASILYPKIEGILRNVAKASGSNNFKQHSLASASLKAFGFVEGMYSRVLPARFEDYLVNVYFANFDPKNVNSLSRNSVAHGVAPIGLFTEKAAIIAILIVEQIYFHLPPDKNAVAVTS